MKKSTLRSPLIGCICLSEGYFWETIVLLFVDFGVPIIGKTNSPLEA
jgi:hypothetical protein